MLSDEDCINKPVSRRKPMRQSFNRDEESDWRRGIDLKFRVFESSNEFKGEPYEPPMMNQYFSGS